ncbi:MAG: hypothetical protein DMF53_07765 [Acidobacteria bacterium]|nr:MAG: hypothetical protein DMF53_07765 [Acidobacteriota bacterium]
MKKQGKKLVLAKETLRILELESARGGTSAGTYYETCSCGVVTTCSGSALPYDCEDLFNPAGSSAC